MSDSKEQRVQPLGLLEEDPTTSGIRLFPRDFQFQQTHGHKSSTGCLGHGPLVLQLLSFTLLAGFLVAILVQVYKGPSSLSQEQSEQDVIYQNLTQLKAAVGELSEKSKLQEIYQELTQLKAAVGELPEKSRLQEIYQELTRLKAAVGELPENSRLQEIYQELTQLKAAVGELPEKSKQQEIYQELTRLKAAVGELPEKSKQQEIYQELTRLKAAVGELPEKSKQQEIYQELTRLKAAVGELPDQSKQQQIYQELTDLKTAFERLCCRCPKDWTFFQGNCYFISNSQRNWHDSVTACQEVGAQLVVIKSAEEQNFLQLQSSRSNRFTWMGLSDLNQEGTWQWVDGSPLSSSFQRYWNSGEPNNSGDEDCAEFSGSGWNDNRCNVDNYWICKKPTACFRDE
uniref:C-type lectin domain family 4 member M n=1 Tax=Nomascus concolor TaxID=29089 RepID=CLC4M_NOMCO|nr:RecName: Full=C-type lectin domain family 4 member M; AltName: Full=CD209 antigen-like protein 1; AltName: CD_antigen=CD299 [Nomascus concolor]AAL89530.1 putative CD209L1 protein [Nomascus concolor]